MPDFDMENGVQIPSTDMFKYNMEFQETFGLYYKFSSNYSLHKSISLILKLKHQILGF